MDRVEFSYVKDGHPFQWANTWFIKDGNYGLRAGDNELKKERFDDEDIVKSLPDSHYEVPEPQVINWQPWTPGCLSGGPRDIMVKYKKEDGTEFIDIGYVTDSSMYVYVYNEHFLWNGSERCYTHNNIKICQWAQREVQS